MPVGNTTKRVLISIIGIPVILAAGYFGSAFFFTFVLTIALISFYEYSLLVKAKGASANTWLGFLGIILLLVNQVSNVFDTYSFFVILLLLLSAVELFRNKGSVIFNIGATLFGILYIGLFAGSLIGIREFYPSIGDFNTRGGFLIISMFIGIWVCDSAAFFGGRSLGKHRLFPRVSPNKSWEGAVFGLLFTIISIVLLKPVILNFLSWTNILAMGFIIGTVGQIGDLIESLIKRDAGVKDSSALLPGHGGIFDRFDSVLYTAPVLLIYLKLFL